MQGNGSRDREEEGVVSRERRKGRAHHHGIGGRRGDVRWARWIEGVVKGGEVGERRAWFGREMNVVKGR